MKAHDEDDFEIEYAIEYVDPHILSEYPMNPRVHTDEDIYAIMQSIKACTFLVPIVVGAGDIILAGHGRLKAALQLGMKKVPIIRTNASIDEDTERLFRLIDNNILSSWDYEYKAIEEEELSKSWDLSEFGMEGWGEDAEDEDDGDNTHEVGGKEEPRIECPQCKFHFFLSEGIIRDDE